MRRAKNHVLIAAGTFVKEHSHKCLCVATLAAATTICQAQLTNPDFEDSTTLTGWNKAGDARVVDSTVPGQSTLLVPPASGNREAIITTIPANGGNATVAFLESLLGLTPGTLTAPGANILGGSGIAQTFNVQAGQTLTFSYDFLTQETPPTTRNDFAFAVITPAGTTSAPLSPALATVDGSALTDFPFGQYLERTYFDKLTPRNTFSYTFPASGQYSLGIGVVDVYTSAGSAHGGNSGLYIDNMKLSAVPEPQAWTVVAGIGLCALALARRSMKSNDLLVRNERTGL